MNSTRYKACLKKPFKKRRKLKPGASLIYILCLAEISDYTAESVRSHWDRASRGTLAQGAVLHFRRVVAEVQCMSCFTKYHPKDGRLICPNCGGVGARIIAGEEFYMEGLDTE